MNHINTLKELVYNQGLNILLQRMAVKLDNKQLRDLCAPVIANANITNIDAVTKIIKQEWPIFNIKDIKINLRHQTVDFKIWGGPYWVNKAYSCYITFKGAWSEVETEEFNYQKTIKEEYAEQNSLPLSVFEEHGIELNII